MHHPFIANRRAALRLGLAGALAAFGGPAFADAISSAKIDASTDMAKAVKKSGKLRIGFSNGFSDAQCR